MFRQSVRSAFALLALSACATDRAPAEGDEAGTSAPAAGSTLAPSIADGGTVSAGGSNVSLPGSASGTPAGQPEASLPPIAIDQCGTQNPAKLNADQVAALRAGGGMPPRLLYPYDGTVFPRGLGAPMLMLENDGASTAYVHMKSSLFEYAGCLPVQGGTVQLPEDVWAEAGLHSRGGGESMTLSLTTLNGSSVRGPVKISITASSATLKGSIYYNSYNSLVATSGLALSGAVMRVRAGKPVELFAQSGQCSGCHSLSANGQRLISTNLTGLDLGGLTSGLTGSANIYNIAPGTAQNPAPARTGSNASFAGISPDGRFYLTSAAMPGFGPLLNGGIVSPVAEATLFESDTGKTVSSAIPRGAMMPSFSADGKLITFADLAQNGGRNVSIMDFDPATGAANNPRVIYSESEGNVGWPFLLPDNRTVVFTLTDSSSFGGGSAFIIPGLWRGPRSDLMMVDIATGKARMLAKAMGYATPADAKAEKTYLPFGDEELHQAYYPTVSPVAAGGYFWVFFDSVRHVGNSGNARQIWGTAIRIPSGEFNEYEEDPSLPAFYVQGQEFGTANHRGFTALDPCRKDGDGCESGVDCCA
ncbi:MAG: hypothetical protein RL385_997, partial [Pseudomonadota bacterium]